MGLLDTQQGNGLMDFGMGLLSAGGPSRMPVGFGQAMGQGMQQMQAGNQQRQATQMQDMQMQNQALHQLLGQQQLQTGQMSMDEARRKMADEIAARKVAQEFYAKQRAGSMSAPSVGAAATNYGAYLNGGTADGGIPLPDMAGYSAARNVAGVPLPDQSGGAHDSQYRQMMGLAQSYEQAGLNDKAMALRDQAAKIAPKFATEFRQAVGADGKLHNYQVADDGTYKEVSLGVKPDFVMENLGGTTKVLDKNLLRNGDSFARTATPGELLVNARKAEELQGAETAFSQGAIDNAAARYNIDGTLPQMGMGKTGSLGRSAILNKAAELAAAGGQAGDAQRIQQIANKGNTAAISKLQQQQTMVGAFERNATKNADMALALSDQVDRSGVPIVNAWVQAGQKSVEGNAKLAQFHAANETFVNEYAKIMSGSMGNTAVSDSAREHAHSLLSTAQNKETYRAVQQTLRAEMGNRMAGFNEEKSALLDSMKPGAKSTSTATAQDSGSVRKYNPSTGKIE